MVSDLALPDLEQHQGIADPKDLPILAAAVREACPWLVTFNVRHYQPGHPSVRVVQTGEFLQQVRAALTMLAQGGGERRPTGSSLPAIRRIDPVYPAGVQ